MILKFNKNIYEDELKPVSSGSRTAFNLSLSIDKDGNQCLVPEEYDIKVVIDSYEEQCSITRIIALNGLGDEAILNAKPGVYLDEEQVKLHSVATDQNALNMELAKLYSNYKDYLTYDEFANAVVHGNFNALERPKEDKKEVKDNA